MATGNLCRFYKFGYCKFRNNCRSRHVDILCENENCDINSCENRHPRVCSFYWDFGRCKFSPCSYKHVTYHDSAKLEHLEKAVKSKTEIINEMKILISSNIDRISKLEGKILTLKEQTNQTHSEIDIRRQNAPPILLNVKESVQSKSSGLTPLSTLKFPIDKKFEPVNTCCEHLHRLDDWDPPPGLCCHHRCRPKRWILLRTSFLSM